VGQAARVAEERGREGKAAEVTVGVAVEEGMAVVSVVEAAKQEEVVIRGVVGLAQVVHLHPQGATPTGCRRQGHMQLPARNWQRAPSAWCTGPVRLVHPPVGK